MRAVKPFALGVVVDGQEHTGRDLSSRGRRVLFAVVSEYIATGEPVGSASIANRYGLAVSSATIRAELADLERQGFLAQPHTSAGRVPSPKGMRAFVDSLHYDSEDLQQEHQRSREQVLSHLRTLRPGIDDVARQSAKLLSSLSGLTAIVTRQPTEQARVLQLRFMPLHARALLAVLVTTAGVIENRVIEVEAPPEDLVLQRVNALVQEHSRGRTLSELLAIMRGEHARAQDEYNQLCALAVQMVEDAADARGSDEPSNVVIEGETSLLGFAEFHPPARMQALLSALDDKARLVALLEQALADRKPEPQPAHVLLADERNDADVGVIGTTYSVAGVSTGTVAVLAPVRVDYARVISLVGSTAEAVGHALSQEPRN